MTLSNNKKKIVGVPRLFTSLMVLDLSLITAMNFPGNLKIYNCVYIAT